MIKTFEAEYEKEITIRCLTCQHVQRVSSTSGDCFCSACGTHITFDLASRNRTFQEIDDELSRIRELEEELKRKDALLEEAEKKYKEKKRGNIFTNTLWVVIFSLAWLFVLLVLANRIQLSSFYPRIQAFYTFLVIITLICGAGYIYNFLKK